MAHASQTVELESCLLMEWNLYNTFNFLEAFLWWGVSAFLLMRVPPGTLQQRAAVIIAAFGFFLFGITDFLEIGRIQNYPLWLWGFKVLCGVMIFCARYAYRGWNTFRVTDREFLFGIFCLLSVLAIISIQAIVVSISAPATASGVITN